MPCAEVVRTLRRDCTAADATRSTDNADRKERSAVLASL